MGSDISELGMLNDINICSKKAPNAIALLKYCSS